MAKRSARSSSRPALHNRTNAVADDDNAAGSSSKRARKRVKLADASSDSEDYCYSEEEDEATLQANVEARRRHCSVFGMRNAFMTSLPSRFSRLPPGSTRHMLQTFVSNNRMDVYQCDSIDDGSFTTVPYACSYSREAKRGGAPRLAIATEQGTVHIVDTKKRQDWDYPPQRTTFQPHDNGIFDVQWSPSDTLLATASGDQSTRISHVAQSDVKTTYELSGHASTVKCVVWDPRRDSDVLCTGGRSGNICLWDLRVGEGRQGTSSAAVMTISNAHDDGKKSAAPRGRKTKVPVPSITSLVYPESDPYGLVSSGSSDGILRHWDLRLPTRKTAKSSTAKATPVRMSSLDPTISNGKHRPRGITSLAAGTGPTAGLLFALGHDSQIHPYTLPALEPLNDELRTFRHENMWINSFYVRIAMSPCGRWLASGGRHRGSGAGGDGDGSMFLFDVGGCAERRMCHPARMRGVELRGQTAEVGALDWADEVVASCSEDRTVRVWRRDPEVYQECETEHEKTKYHWCSAVRE